VLVGDVSVNGVDVEIDLPVSALVSASARRRKRDIEDVDADVLGAILEAMADAAIDAVNTQCQDEDTTYSCCGFENSDYSGPDLTDDLCNVDQSAASESWTTTNINNGMVYEKTCTTVLFTYDGDSVYMTFFFKLPTDSLLCVAYDAAQAQTIAADSYVGQATLVEIANDESFNDEIVAAVIDEAQDHGITITTDEIKVYSATATTASIPGSESGSAVCHVTLTAVLVGLTCASILV